jgi:predicted metalloendopeptidase
MKRLLSLAIALIAGPAAAQSGSPRAVETKPVLGAWGVDLSNLDPSVKPGDDFYRYVNGRWLAQDRIPPDRPAWGSFNELQKVSEQRVQQMIDGLKTATGVEPGSDAQKIRDFYASFADEAAVNTRGLAPARADLERLGRVASYEEVAAALGDPALNIASPFNFYRDIDAKDPDSYTIAITQGGLGLPDRDFYLRDDEQFPQIRKQYAAAIAKMLAIAGDANAERDADSIVALERAIAEVSWPNADRRDADKTYNPVNRAELAALAPAFPWDAFLKAGELAKQDRFVANEKSAFPKLAEVFRKTPLSTWQAYLRFHYLHGFAPYLTTELADANFAFFGTVLNNQPAQLPRATRAVRLVSSQVGEAIGRLYVEKYFPPSSKAQMEALVANLRAALEERIRKLDWMSDATKTAALVKLSQFTVKIGYPNKWIDYGPLTVAPNDLLGNVQRAGVFQWRRQLAKLPGPVDREEWGMTPQTVNAYYNPNLNEIVFPAAILQPPFFDPNADPAVNYGGIGAVIGHEIGHGFDDQGSKFDGKGVLRGWWTDADRSRFDARTKQLVDEYAKFEPLPGIKVNGQVTLGENIGDLGGIEMAYHAYHRSLGGNRAATIDGFSGDQRFFLAFAQIWRQQVREGFLRNQVLADPHSPAEFRVNGVVPNVAEWYEAFGVPANAKLALPGERRVSIW